MLVYVEVVLFENLLIDGLILYLVAKTLKQKTNWLGLCVSSLFGSLFALFSIKIKASVLILIFIKLLVCFLMSVMLCFNFQKIFKKAFLLFFYTFLFGGMILCVFNFLGISNNFSVFVGYASSLPIGGIIALVVIFFIVLKKNIERFLNYKKISCFLFDVNLKVNGKCLNLKGFLDTGNTLETKDGKPILMISQKFLKKIFSVDERLSIFLKKYQNLNIKSPQTFSVFSVSGKTEVFVFEPQSCKINRKEKKVVVGIYDDLLFSKKDFGAILSPQMLEDWNVKKITKKHYFKMV